MTIEGLEEFGPINWFYHPEFSDSRKQLELRRIDTHHLLTRTRTALNKGGVGLAKLEDFVKVAEDRSTKLKVAMLVNHLNMQSTDYALITFAEDVEEGLRQRGCFESAETCRLVSESIISTINLIISIKLLVYAGLVPGIRYTNISSW